MKKIICVLLVAASFIINSGKSYGDDGSIRDVIKEKRELNNNVISRDEYTILLTAKVNNAYFVRRDLPILPLYQYCSEKGGKIYTALPDGKKVDYINKISDPYNEQFFAFLSKPGIIKTVTCEGSSDDFTINMRLTDYKVSPTSIGPAEEGLLAVLITTKKPEPVFHTVIFQLHSPPGFQDHSPGAASYLGFFSILA